MNEIPGTGGHRPDPTRVVSCELAFNVIEPAELVLQLAASATSGRAVDERLEAATGDHRLSTAEVLGPHGTRAHLLSSPVGRLTVSYRCELLVSPPDPAPGEAIPDGPSARSSAWAAVDESPSYQRLVYLRPSRYCPSDHLVGFAVAEFGIESGVADRAGAIADWIRDRVGYVAGFSSVHDSAEHTLLTGMGTCRDFAHLGVALCRAVGIPARFASVYAPGLFPMDFHAVFEVLDRGSWYAYDATDLAPRQSMVRIATGRDAADAAFASVIDGIATLEQIEVTATTGGGLPVDRPEARIQLA
jgi:transglutaminase-like putative cysteine protease